MPTGFETSLLLAFRRPLEMLLAALLRIFLAALI